MGNHRKRNERKHNGKHGEKKRFRPFVDPWDILPFRGGIIERELYGDSILVVQMVPKKKVLKEEVKPMGPLNLIPSYEEIASWPSENFPIENREMEEEMRKNAEEMQRLADEWRKDKENWKKIDKWSETMMKFGMTDDPDTWPSYEELELSLEDKVVVATFGRNIAIPV